MVLGYIEDGYTEHAYIEAIPRLYPALRFSYRPMLQSERGAYSQALGAAKQAVDERKLSAQVLKQKLVSWDLRNQADELVPLSADNLLRVKQKLFDRLFLIVSGEQPSDDDPDRKPSKGEADTEAQRLFDALSQGKPLTDVCEAADAKN